VYILPRRIRAPISFVVSLLPDCIILAFAAFPLTAQTQLSSDLRRRSISSLQMRWSNRSPERAVAVVKNGQIAYLKPTRCTNRATTAATSQMRYSIGSISKQFTATAILLLQEKARSHSTIELPVHSRPHRASEVTIRQLLSHTSGYQTIASGLCDAMMLEP